MPDAHTLGQFTSLGWFWDIMIGWGPTCYTIVAVGFLWCFLLYIVQVIIRFLSKPRYLNPFKHLCWAFYPDLTDYLCTAKYRPSGPRGPFREIVRALVTCQAMAEDVSDVPRWEANTQPMPPPASPYRPDLLKGGMCLGYTRTQALHEMTAQDAAKQVALLQKEATSLQAVITARLQHAQRIPGDVAGSRDSDATTATITTMPAAMDLIGPASYQRASSLQPPDDELNALEGAIALARPDARPGVQETKDL